MKRVGVLTISDSRTLGERSDTSTALISRLLKDAGYVIEYTGMSVDEGEQIQARLIEMADDLALPLIITTGGTGLGPRDVTPEATRGIIQREVQGLSELMRSATANKNEFAYLSRGVCGLRGSCLIVNLPGSPKGVEECLQVLIPLLGHALEMVQGHSHG